MSNLVPLVTMLSSLGQQRVHGEALAPRDGVQWAGRLSMFWMMCTLLPLLFTTERTTTSSARSMSFSST